MRSNGRVYLYRRWFLPNPSGSSRLQVEYRGHHFYNLVNKQLCMEKNQGNRLWWPACKVTNSYTIGSPYHFDILHLSSPQHRSKSQETHSDHCSGIHREESRWLHYKGVVVTILQQKVILTSLYFRNCSYTTYRISC